MLESCNEYTNFPAAGGIVILQNSKSSVPFNLTMQFFDWVLDLPQKKWIK